MACIFSFAIKFFRGNVHAHGFTVEMVPRFIREDFRNWIYSFFQHRQKKKKESFLDEITAGPKERDITGENKQVQLVKMLSNLDESELLEIYEMLCSEVEVNSLCEKINEQIKKLVNADYCLIYIVQDICHCKLLVERGRRMSSFNQNVKVRDSRSSHWGVGITGHVAKTGEVINIPNIDDDPRFKGAEDLPSNKVKSVLCLPIQDNEAVIGVIQMGRTRKNNPFSKSDEEILISFLKLFAIGLKNKKSLERVLFHLKRNQILLELTSTIFDERKNLDEIIYAILKHALESAGCERTEVMILSPDRKQFSLDFFMDSKDLHIRDSFAWRRESEAQDESVDFSVLATHVTKTGETLNIEDVTKDERFGPIENSKGFKYTTLLCLPIKNPEGEVIGVLLFINKDDGLRFTSTDEVFVEAFSLLCGMGIHNQQMLEKIQVAKAKLEVTIEILSYHVLAPIEEAIKLKKEYVPSADNLGIYSFKFDNALLNDNETLLAVIRMFMELGLIEKFQIEYLVLCRWVITVKKNYRDVLYHNWYHALNATQLIFAMITITGWYKLFGDNVTIGMLIGSLCHDLDHRGTNNEFQVEAHTPLSKLYASSPMERHHLDLCIMILNSQGTEILSHVSPEDYKNIIQTTERVILSTDLSSFFCRSKKFQDLIQEKRWDFSEENNQNLLQTMLMTAGDLGSIARPWDISIVAAARAIGEFFQQGDIERWELHLTPTDIMNREKGRLLPKLEIDFIDIFCVPLYQNLAELSSDLVPLYEQLLANREMWMQESRRQSIKESEFFKLLVEYNIYVPDEDGSGPALKE